jgi:hypothetical protein
MMFVAGGFRIGLRRRHCGRVLLFVVCRFMLRGLCFGQQNADPAEHTQDRETATGCHRPHSHDSPFSDATTSGEPELIPRRGRVIFTLLRQIVAPQRSGHSKKMQSQRAGSSASVILAVLFFVSPVFAHIEVKGRFLYEDREVDERGFTGRVVERPIRYASVKLYSGSSLVGGGITDENGYYAIFSPVDTGTIHTVCESTSVTASGLFLDLRVPREDLSPGDLYSAKSEPKSISNAVKVDLGTSTARAANGTGPAFNIWDVAIDGALFVSLEAHGAPPEIPLTLLWQKNGGPKASFFQSGPQRMIFVAAQAAYDDAVIAREYARFIENLYIEPGGVSGSDAGPASPDLRRAWKEGLATFLACRIRKFNGRPRPDLFVTTDGENLLASFEIESLTGVPTIAGKTGSTNSLAVAAALWDITDGVSTGDAFPGSDDDGMERPFGDVWRVLSSYIPTANPSGASVEDFWDGWFSPKINNGYRASLESVFSVRNGIEFIADPQEPDDVAAAAHTITVTSAPALSNGSHVALNEIHAGTTNALELHNTGDAEAELTGWHLVCGRTGSPPVTLSLPEYRLAPGGFVIVTEASGVHTNSVLYLGADFPWVDGAGGFCRLSDAGGTPADFVRWGDSTEPATAGTSFTGDNPAPPAAGRSLGRSFETTDTGSGGDWSPQSPTLGSFNATGNEAHYTYFGSGDVDIAAFDATAGKHYIVETLGLENGADTVLTLVTPDGVSVLARNDDYGLTQASRIQWSATASGRYFVRSTRSDHPSNVARYGSYRLRVIASDQASLFSFPATLTVSNPGQGGKYGSIAAALLAADNGDTIQVDSGIYREALVIEGKSVTLSGATGKSPVLEGPAGSGATLRLVNTKSVWVEGLIIRGSSAGVRVEGGTATIVNTILERSSGGDGIQLAGAGTHANIVHCTIAGNAKNGVALSDSATADVVNTIIYRNGEADISSVGGAVVSISNSFIGSGAFAGSNGNLRGDPQFFDFDRGDFHLKPTSPAIDAGTRGFPDLPARDAEGIPRSIDANESGSPVPDMGAYEYLPSAALTMGAVFPQIVAGGGYRTSIIALNTGGVSATTSIAFTRSDGDPMVVQNAQRAGSSFNLSIPPWGSARIDAGSTDSVASGYATVQSNLPLTGSAIFKFVNGDAIVSEAGVGLSGPARRFTIYIDNRNGALSGYAIANFGLEPANLTLNLRGENGTTLETRGLLLEGGRHVAEFAAQRFPTTAPGGFQGTIEFDSDQAVCAVALRYDNLDSSVFSTIPVLVDDAAATLHFPQVADGAGYRTNFILINPSEKEVTARIDFFAADGTHMHLPVQGTLESTHELLLMAKGAAQLITDGSSGALKVGWARVTSSSPIGGSAIFQTFSGSRILSEAGVASSPAAARLAVYVDSLGSTESGLAICNPNAIATTVSLRLRSVSGTVVAATTFDLPPMAHTARFFTEWFPRGFDEFEGTLEVLASDPVSAVALRFDNPGGTVFATLPAIALP